MMELFDDHPRIDVPAAEYHRLLGYPPDGEISERAQELAQWTRDWYATNGKPWTYARQAEFVIPANGQAIVDIVSLHSVSLNGVSLNGELLQSTLSDANAHGVFLAAVSAGPEVASEANRAWQEGRPDEYFFLETYGSAVVEHLTTMVGAELCAWAESEGMAVLPHFSPGYNGWSIADQAPLLDLILHGNPHQLAERLSVLNSGMLRPKKSQLAVFGLTRHVDRIARFAKLNSCERCSFKSCAYRRAPYLLGGRNEPVPGPAPAVPDVPLVSDGDYGISRKALARWAAERLEFSVRGDGVIDASFRYDGTTCTNQGRPLAYRYRVALGPRERGYPIQSQNCEPMPGDVGFQSMCSYLKDANHLMRSVRQDQPLLGRPLNDVLAWRPPRSSAGCYCATEDRLHKWRQVLETIHFALAQQEMEPSSAKSITTVLS